MNENFNKFKKRLLLEHTLRTTLFALAIGLTTAGLYGRWRGHGFFWSFQ